MTKSTLATAKEVVDELGGPTAAARYLGVVPSAVTNWLRHGRIPPHWSIKLRRDFLQRNLLLEDSVFDSPWPERPKPARLGASG